MRKPKKAGVWSIESIAPPTVQQLSLSYIILPPFMSSQAVDYDALEASTSIEEITENEFYQDTLRSLKNDDLPALFLCTQGAAVEGEGLGHITFDSSRELDWLGHFARKSTCLNEFGMYGMEIFDRCSGQSVDKFFENLGRCNHIEKMRFDDTDLAGLIYKLGPVMKNNNITQWTSDGCFLGVPEAKFLFNTFRDMKSLGELCISDDNRAVFDYLDDDVVAGCIPSLAACTGMWKLVLKDMLMSTQSCAALGAIFPRMAALLELNLGGNSIDDNSVDALVHGLADCKNLISLKLSHNMIGDGGLDVLIQGLPATVGHLEISYNEITFAREMPLLRFKTLHLSGNALSSDGARVVAASLANPECRLEKLNLAWTNVGDVEAAILAPSLRSNQRLAMMSLTANSITETGWNAFSSVLCDTGSVNATHDSNHTLQALGYGRTIPQDIKMLLKLNHVTDKSRVAANKILQFHRHLDMRPLFGWEFGLLPYVIAWLEFFADSRLDLKVSSIFEFVRAMPMKVTDRLGGKTKGKKRKLNSQ